jgi:hypothetical protein
VNLTLYSSVLRRETPNLASVQDEIFDGLPTVLVCPLKAGMPQTAFRVAVDWHGTALVACPDLTRQIRRGALRRIGLLDEHASREIIFQLRRILAR